MDTVFPLTPDGYAAAKKWMEENGHEKRAEIASRFINGNVLVELANQLKREHQQE